MKNLDVLYDTVKEAQPEIARRQARLLDFWAGKDIGRPPLTFMPYNLGARQMFADPVAQLEKYGRCYQTVMALPGDFVPAFWPDLGTISLASVFGGEVLKESDGQRRWIKPAFQTIEDIVHVEPPEILSGLVKEEFDRCRRWREATRGLGLVAPPDMQGPVNIASLLLDTSELLAGFYTEPETVRRLLRLCADVILGVLAAYRKEFGPAFVPVTWPHVWFPDGFGLTLTQDSIPFLSPALYREFELPLVREISRANGGVYVHCCGDCEHALADLATIPNLIGFDHAYPHCHTGTAARVLGTRTTFSVGVSSRGAAEFPAQDVFIKHLLPTLPKGARLWHVLPADDPAVSAGMLEALGLPEMRAQYETAVKELGLTGRTG